jgi:hypothetical protein
MKAVLPSSQSGFDRPATYRIAVQGRVPAKWLDRLEGMTITERPAEADSTVTTLRGELSDQAALEGVLDTLFALHLPVISVERLSAGSEGGTTAH